MLISRAAAVLGKLFQHRGIDNCFDMDQVADHLPAVVSDDVAGGEL